MGDEAEWAFDEVVKLGGGTARFIDALRAALGESDMMAHLVMMAVRLDALHRKLKVTGSLYLHCDSTASIVRRLCSTDFLARMPSQTRSASGGVDK